MNKKYEVKLVPVEMKDKELLWKLLQKYIFEMTEFYPDSIGMDGDYGYQNYEAYFKEGVSDRFAKLIIADEELAGFIMVNKHAFTEELIDYAIAEFSVFPKFRGTGVAKEAFCKLIENRAGTWQLKYLPDNERGARFWCKMTNRLDSREIELEEERVLLFYVEK